MTTAVWVLTVIATLVFLRFASTLFVPIALAALISYALYPGLLWLERLRVPRVLGAALILLALGGTCFWGAYALADDATRLVQQLPGFSTSGTAQTSDQHSFGIFLIIARCQYASARSGSR